jgi:DNA ligase-1
LALAEIAEVFAAMAIARTTAVRAALVEGLLRRATPIEAKYLLKLMLGDMRIGVKQSLIEEAIVAAASSPEAPITPAQVRHAVMLEADLGKAVRHAFAGTLAEARMTLFHPLGFMLASPVDTPEEAVARFTANSKAASEEGTTQHGPAQIEAFLEDKYDGMRAQLHCGNPTQPGPRRHLLAQPRRYHRQFSRPRRGLRPRPHPHRPRCSFYPRRRDPWLGLRPELSISRPKRAPSITSCAPFIAASPR